MGFVRYGSNGWIIGSDGKPVYIVGVNYVASYVCTNFLEDWCPDAIEADLRRIAELGWNAVRIPVFWGFAEPEEGVFNPLAFERLDQFLELAARCGIYVMPWFLVGIATVQKDVPYRNGRPYFEGAMLRAAENHLRTFARRYRDDERILFWDICDEPEFYARDFGAEALPYDAQRFKHWLTHMYEAFKKEDPNHLVALGFGEIATENFGYTLRDAADVLDVMTVTCYPYDSSVEGLDTVRNNYYPSFYAKMNSFPGKPVFTCEAPGFSTVAFSEEMIGRYFQVSLYSGLLAGSTGVLPWCYNDFHPSIWEGRELDHQPLEPWFGLVANDGRLKASGEALRAFGQFVQAAGITDYAREKPQVGVLVPEGYYGDVWRAKRQLRAAMQFAKGCGADIDFIWDDRDFTEYALVVAPAMAGAPPNRHMRTSVWRRLAEYVAGGGTLLHSYDGIRGLNAHFPQLFGVEVQTRHKDFGQNRLRMERVFSRFREGEAVDLPGGGREEYLIVEPRGAEAVARFENGHPAMLKHPYGRGTAWLWTAPFHDGVFEMPLSAYLAHPIFYAYDGILAEMGLRRPARYVHPELECGLFTRPDGQRLLIALNHGAGELSARLRLDPDLAKRTMRQTGSTSNMAAAAPDGLLELRLPPAAPVTIEFFG